MVELVKFKSEFINTNVIFNAKFTSNVYRQVDIVREIEQQSQQPTPNSLASSFIPIYAIGDKQRFQQVVLNMMMNAVNNTIDEDIIINVSYDNESSKVKVEITDKGIGIQEQDQD